MEGKGHDCLCMGEIGGIVRKGEREEMSSERK